jgi:hypothetical protein
MIRRQVVTTLVCAAGLLAACAPRARVAADRESPPQPLLSTTSHGLAVTLTKRSGKRATSFMLELKNPGKLTEVRFASGKTHDFVVLDEKDREVWRWSSGRLFTQSLQTKQLKTGDSIRFEATWDSVAPGHYRVVASLNSAAMPEALEQEFVVR